MIRWGPSPAEERWLTVADELGSAVPRSLLAEHAGGWRSTGPLARIALFMLGHLAATLLLGILGFGQEIMLLVAGLIATFAAEWLKVQKRLHASGVEEALGVSGFLMIGFWVALRIVPAPELGGSTLHWLVLIVAGGAAGLRYLNPFITTCAMIAFVYWVGSSAGARTLDPLVGGGMTAFTSGCALAAVALALGARLYRRPSHDRMLDWLVATLPLAAYAQHATWGFHALAQAPGGVGAGRPATVAMLLALGVAMLLTGLRRRRHAPLLGFLGCVAGLAVELRLATTIAAETWLIGFGLVALFAGVALDRYLRQPRNGVTSSKLNNREGPLDLLQTAGAAVLAQRSAPDTPPQESTYTPGGGKFGGGGASGGY